LGGSPNGAIINSGANIKFQASNSISLNPGFKAQKGSNVALKHIDCGQLLLGSSLKSDVVSEEVATLKSAEVNEQDTVPTIPVYVYQNVFEKELINISNVTPNYYTVEIWDNNLETMLKRIENVSGTISVNINSFNNAYNIKEGSIFQVKLFKDNILTNQSEFDIHFLNSH
jgi:hypothetical protein